MMNDVRPGQVDARMQKGGSMGQSLEGIKVLDLRRCVDGPYLRSTWILPDAVQDFRENKVI